MKKKKTTEKYALVLEADAITLLMIGDLEIKAKPGYRYRDIRHVDDEDLFEQMFINPT